MDTKEEVFLGQDLQVSFRATARNLLLSILFYPQIAPINADQKEILLESMQTASLEL